LCISRNFSNYQATAQYEDDEMARNLNLEDATRELRTAGSDGGRSHLASAAHFGLHHMKSHPSLDCDSFRMCVHCNISILIQVVKFFLFLIYKFGFYYLFISFFQSCILFESLITMLTSTDCMVVYFLYLSTGGSELNILSRCKYCCSVKNTILLLLFRL
jgi:hypothetical protein